MKGLKLFFFSAQYAFLNALLAFKVSVEKSAVILMALPLYCLYSPYMTFNILSLFSVLIVLAMVCCGEVLFWSYLFDVLEASFLYLDGHLFLEIWKVFCYGFVQYISCAFSFFFYADNSQVWSFDGVTELLHIPFAALQSFVFIFFCSFFNIYFVSES
jgi:hypothetical protein